MDGSVIPFIPTFFFRDFPVFAIFVRYYPYKGIRRRSSPYVINELFIFFFDVYNLYNRIIPITNILT